MTLLSSFVDRQSLASTPREVIGPRLWVASFAIALSGGLHGMNTSMISGILAMSDMAKLLRLSSRTAADKADITGWITSSLALGLLIGAVVCFVVSDRIGRKPLLFLSAMTYNIGSIVQMTMSHNAGSRPEAIFIAGRTLSGIGGGMGTVIGTAYLAEIAPKAVRGTVTGLFPINIMGGVALGYWINYFCVLGISATSSWQWRAPVVIQIYPGLLMCLTVPFLPESPRWLMMRGRDDEAKRSLLWYRRLDIDHPYVAEELAMLERQRANEASISTASWAEMCRQVATDASLRQRFVLVLVSTFIFIFSGGNSITYYQSTILKTIGISSATFSLLFSGIYGLCKVSAVFIYSMFFSDRFGRRPNMLIGTSICIVCVAYIAAYLGTVGAHSTPGETSAAAYVAVVALFIFAIGYGLGPAPVTFTLNSEVFPAAIRGKLMSVMICVQYVLNFGLSRGFSNMTVAMKPYGPFVLFACVSFAGLVYMFLAQPETKGLQMEQIDQLFSYRWYNTGLHSRKIRAAVADHDRNVTVPGAEEQNTSEGSFAEGSQDKDKSSPLTATQDVAQLPRN